MKLNNTKIIYATKKTRKNFEGKMIKEERKSDCVSCEIEMEKKDLKEGKK
jgi:hypothetical protein